MNKILIIEFSNKVTSPRMFYKVDVMTII